MARDETDTDDTKVQPNNAQTHDLLVRFKHGEIEVIDVLYPRFSRVFIAAAMNRGLIWQDAEDVMSESIARMYRGIQSYKEAGGAGDRWLWSIFRSSLIDFYKKNVARFSDALLEVADEVPDGDPNMDDVLITKKSQECLDVAFEGLSPIDRFELWRGPGRGRLGRTAWREAASRMKSLYHACYGEGASGGST